MPTPARNPAAEYARRLAERQEVLRRQVRRYARLRRWRRALLGLVVLFAWLGDKERVPTKIMLIGVPAGVLEVIDRRKKGAGAAWRRADQAVAYYERRLLRVAESWAGTGEPGLGYLNETHPYAPDLDLFGAGGMFERLCLECTPLGEETLARWLLESAPAQEVRARQEAVAALRERLDFREDLALLAMRLPAGEGLKQLVAWSQLPQSPPVASGGFIVPGARIAASAVGIFTFLTLLGSCAFGAGWLLLIPTLLMTTALSVARRYRVRKTLAPLEGRERDLARLADLLARLEREPFARGTGINARAVARLARLVDAIPVAPAGFLFLAETQLALAIDAWRRRYGPALAGWITAAARTEALSAIATYAFENPDDPFPDFVPDGPVFDAVGLGHPLLARDRCVANDVRLDSSLRLLVVSGSNMSGKSTLLRSVGVNVVLARAGAPVRARHLRLSELTVAASLRVQDSLQAGRSRFFAEVTRVRQVLDLAQSRPPVLFLLDELFQGTNSRDRRVGAEAVVRTLLDAGALGLITTHDLALTDIADLLAPHAANVHFADHVEDGVMAFDHKMRPGVVPSSNGLALMRAVGIKV